MQSCKICGAAIPDDEKACPTCGAAVGAQPTPQSDSQPAAPTGEPAANAPQPLAGQKKKLKPWQIVLVAILTLVVLSNISKCVGNLGAGSTPANNASSTATETAEKANDDSSNGDGEAWPTKGIAQLIPAMNKKCESVLNDEDSLYIDINNAERTDYDNFVEGCKEKGFTIDAEEDEEDYEAYNNDGYNLRVSFYEADNDKTITINVDAPKTNGKLKWPTRGQATKLPDPKKSKGSIEYDSSTSFSAYVGEVSQEEYSDYVDACIDAGFDKNYYKGDEYSSAENAAGDSLTVEYRGMKTMYVSLYAASDSDSSSKKSEKKSDDSEKKAKKKEAAKKETKKASTSASKKASKAKSKVAKAASSAIDSKFKDAMDSYEDFMDGYVEFMKKYKKSGNSASMMQDYLKYMEDYETTMKKFEKMDDGSLNAAEEAYYIKVQTRVNKKLAEVAE